MNKQSAISRAREPARETIALVLMFITTAVLPVLVAASSANALDVAGTAVEPKWVRTLPSSVCPGTNHTDCHPASPVLADLTSDGLPEVIVATNKGYVIAFRQDGQILWQKDTAGWFGMAAGAQVIASSPAVADIDQDGRPEVVVGSGTWYASVCTQGGVIVLEHDGTLKSGWPFLARDGTTPPAGCHDTVFSTPALGDLDRDGDLEIVFGSFDKGIYAMHDDGSVMNGFPIDSALYARLGWEDLSGRIADTIWSSPALGDLDGDGYLDIVIGTDEGNFDDSFPPASGWVCPYQTPTGIGYCGGSVYAVDRFGNTLPGWPRYMLEIIQSTPALADIDNDGRAEVFVGTGTYYHINSPDSPTSGFRVYGIDSDGQDLVGWEGGKLVGGSVPFSPVVGDIAGDTQPEIIIAARDQKLYAWHLNGNPVAGFPMVPKTQFGQVIDRYNAPRSVVLGDYTGNGRMEILIATAWGVAVISGQGQQLTSSSTSDNRNFFSTNGTLANTPAIGDLDGNGHLELVASNSELFVWDLPQSTAVAEWPMFKHNAARTSSVVKPVLNVAPNEIMLLHEAGRSSQQTVQVTLAVNNAASYQWQLESSQSGVSFSPASGTASGTAQITVTATLGSNLSPGTYTLSDISASATVGGTAVVNSPASIPLKVRVVDELHQTYLPVVQD